MRILVLSWREIANPRAGGAEVVTFEHMRRWAADGHQVTLFTAGYPGAPGRGERDGVQIVRRGTESSVHLAAQHWYRRLRRHPDIVVDEVHGVPFGAAGYAAVPVVGWIYEVAQSIWFRMYPFPIAAAGRFLEAAALRWYALADVPFITDSRSTATDLMALGVARFNIEVIEPAIARSPLCAFPEKEGKPTIIVVGRLVRMKGVHDAILAFSLVRARLPSCRLWIVGSGPDAYVSELYRLSSQLGLGDSVRFLGRVSEDEKYRLLARAHILVHPSQREGWGINVIEANAMATPTIAYRVAGLSDSVLDGRTGLLCPHGRPDGLANAILSLFASPERYRTMQRSALDWSGQFTWGGAAARSTALLQRVAEGQAVGRGYFGRRRLSKRVGYSLKSFLANRARS